MAVADLLKTIDHDQNNFNFVKVSGNGKYTAMAKDTFGSVKMVYDIENDIKILNKDEDSRICDIDYHGTRFAFGGFDFIEVYDETGNLILDKTVSYGGNLALTPDGKKIIAGFNSADEVAVYDLDSETILNTYQADSISGINLSPDGSILIIVDSGTNEIILLNISDLSVKQKISYSLTDTPNLCKLDYNNSILAIAHEGEEGTGYLKVYDLELEKEIYSYSAYCLALGGFLQNNDYLLIAEGRSYLSFINLETKTIEYQVQGDPDYESKKVNIGHNSTKIILGSRHYDYGNGHFKIYSYRDFEQNVYIKNTDTYPIIFSTEPEISIKVQFNGQRYNTDSDIIQLEFINKTPIDIQDVTIHAINEATGVTAEFSKTLDPFDALSQLTFSGPYSEDETDTFYLKFRSDSTASTGEGSFDLKITAEYVLA